MATAMNKRTRWLRVSHSGERMPSYERIRYLQVHNEFTVKKLHGQTETEFKEARNEYMARKKLSKKEEPRKYSLSELLGLT